MILALDPAPHQTAWVQYHPSGEIAARGISSTADMFDAILPQLRFDVIACEMVACYGMAVGASVFETARMVGRFEQFSKGRCKFDVVYRKDVKMHLCQSMRAKDGNVRQALIDRFGPPGTKKQPGKTYGISKDIWAALAVAVTYAETKLNKEEV